MNFTTTNGSVPESEEWDWNCSALSQRTERVIGYCGTFLGVASLFVNMVCLYAMRHVNDGSASYHRFMRHLATSDFLSCSSFLFVSYLLNPILRLFETDSSFVTIVIPYVVRSFPWMFFTAYFFALFCLTASQYVAVCHPWRYSELDRCVNVCIYGIWVLSSLQIIIPLAVVFGKYAVLNYNFREAAKTFHVIGSIEIQVWLAVFVLFTLVNILLNYLVYTRLRHLQHKRRDAHSPRNIECNSIRMKREVFVTVLLLLFATVLCRLPFPIIGIVGLKYYTSCLMNAGSIFLLYLNFFVDPIIFILRVHELREVCLRLLSWPRRSDVVNKDACDSTSLRRGATERFEITTRLMADGSPITTTNASPNYQTNIARNIAIP